MISIKTRIILCMVACEVHPQPDKENPDPVQMTCAKCTEIHHTRSTLIHARLQNHAAESREIVWEEHEVTQEDIYMSSSTFVQHNLLRHSLDSLRATLESESMDYEGMKTLCRSLLDIFSDMDYGLKRQDEFIKMQMHRYDRLCADVEKFLPITNQTEIKGASFSKTQQAICGNWKARYDLGLGVLLVSLRVPETQNLGLD